MTINQRKIGVILSYISEVIKILTGLLYTPIMLRLLGKSEYGLYQLVYSVVSYLSLLSLGFGTSYIRFYSQYKANKDEDGIARLNGMFMIVFSVISVICVFCGMIMLINIRKIFNTGLTENEYTTARILMALMVVNLTMTFPNAVFNCNITANERFFFQKILIIIQNILNPFIALPLLIMGYGSIGVVSVVTFLTFSTLICNIVFCFKNLHMKFIFSNFNFALFKEMYVFTFFIFLNQIIDQINWSVDKFLLGRILGTTAVAVYGVGGQINTMYLQFSTAISNVFIPKVNKIVTEENDNHKLTLLFTKIGRIQFMLLALILSGFTFFGRDFIQLWAGNGYKASYSVTLLLIYPVTVPLIQNLGIEIQRAKNKHKTRSVVYFFIGIANIFISIPLVKVFGPSGAALGTSFTLVMGNIIFMNWYYHNRIGLDMIYFWKNIVKIVPAIIIPCITGLVFTKFFVFNSWIRLIIGASGYAIIYSISMLILGMNEYEKNMFLLFHQKISNNYIYSK